jgi:hypothetical protein
MKNWRWRFISTVCKRQEGACAPLFHPVIMDGFIHTRYRTNILYCSAFLSIVLAHSIHTGLRGLFGGKLLILTRLRDWLGLCVRGTCA